MDEFTAALQAHSWPAIVGLALTLIAPAIGTIITGKVSPYAEKWVSLFRGLALGVGPVLAVGATWWIALITGIVGLLQSDGFQRLIRDVIPDWRGGPR